MYALLFALPALLAGLALFIVLLRAFAWAWTTHRFKMALLEKLEHRPELARGLPELTELYARGAPSEGRLSFAVMGGTLALLGVLFLLAGQHMGFGRMATGLYFGGAACVPLGFSLALAGAFLRVLGWDDVDSPPDS